MAFGAAAAVAAAEVGILQGDRVTHCRKLTVSKFKGGRKAQQPRAALHWEALRLRHPFRRKRARRKPCPAAQRVSSGSCHTAPGASPPAVDRRGECTASVNGRPKEAQARCLRRLAN